MTETELVDVFAANLRRARVDAGLTQQQVAEALGMHRPYVSDLESGKRTPLLKNLARIATIVHSTPSELLAPARRRGRKVPV